MAIPMTLGLTNIGTFLITGLSTDTKPDGDIPPGSTFIETDTGRVFAWLDAGVWLSAAPLRGLSTSIKPVVGVSGGAVYIETDTGQIAAFNGATWVKPVYL